MKASAAQRRRVLQERIARGEHTPRRFASHLASQAASHNAREIAAMKTQIKQHADKGHDSAWAFKTGAQIDEGHHVPGLVRC